MGLKTEEKKINKLKQARERSPENLFTIEISIVFRPVGKIFLFLIQYLPKMLKYVFYGEMSAIFLVTLPQYSIFSEWIFKVRAYINIAFLLV